MNQGDRYPDWFLITAGVIYLSLAGVSFYAFWLMILALKKYLGTP